MAKKRSAPRVTRTDRVIEKLSPKWALGRVQARAAFDQLSRHYEAAGSGRRNSGWNKTGSDANRAIGGALPTLRAISRDLRRNNPWARRAIEVIAANTVGWGIEGKPTFDGDAPDALRDAATRAWLQWANTPACDYDGRTPFRGLQRLVMEAVAESGEALIVREPTLDPRLPVPMRIRVLEGDYLDHQRDGMMGEAGPIVQGIELNERGERVAYHLYQTHPGGQMVHKQRFVPIRVPAERVIHVYRVERPGQMRGVPWLAPVIARIKDFGLYEDAILEKAKVEACFGALVTDFEGQATALGKPGTQGGDYLDALEPGMIEYLPPGKDVKFAQPTSNSNHESYSKTSLQGVAAGANVTYEDLTWDFSNVNFSSARMARLSHWRSVESWRHDMLVPTLCDGVFGWWAQLAASLNNWPRTPSALWSAPPMPMIDPAKEGKAAKDAIRSAIKTLPQTIRERGGDPRAHLDEIAEGNRMLDERGIITDSDPRHTSTTGQAHPKAPGEDDGGEGDEPGEPGEE